MEDDQGLRVNVAKLEDAGRYTCVAENPAGRRDLDIPLDVWGEETYFMTVTASFGTKTALYFFSSTNSQCTNRKKHYSFGTTCHINLQR